LPPDEYAEQTPEAEEKQERQMQEAHRGKGARAGPPKNFS
jgi:hypothetical protein